MPHLPVRTRTDARLAGVCSALARAWSVDPLIVRVAFVVLALMTNGFIVFAYLALWAILPEEGGLPPLQRLIPATRSWSSATLLTVVLVVAAAAGAVVSGSGPGAFVILALAWVILRFGFAGRRRRAAGEHPAPPPPPAPVTPFERYAQAWQQRLDNVAAGRPADWAPAESDPPGLYGPTSPYDAPAAAPPAQRRQGRRAWLGVAVGLGATWAGLATASALDVAVPDLAWVAGTLLVLGVALLFSAHPVRAAWGRPALLLPVTILVALGMVPLLVEAASPASAPRAIGAAGVQRLPVGEHVLDLSDRPVASETLSYRLDVGDLVLTVPREGNVVVRSRTDLGGIRSPGGTEEGLDVTHEWRRVSDLDAPTLTIDVSVGVGEVEVRS